MLVRLDMVDGRGCELLGVGAGGVERSEQGQGLAAGGVLDDSELYPVNTRDGAARHHELITAKYDLGYVDRWVVRL
jgi:hypothetical protein